MSKAAAVGRLSAVLLGLVLGPGICLAQTTSAALAGKVLDGQGAAQSGAVVQARSEQTGEVRTGVTDREGEYRIDLLKSGRWTVVARGAADGVSESRSVVLSLQSTVRLDLVIGGGFVEEVHVTAAAPVFDTQRVGGRLHILGEQTDVLPIAGGSVTDLALLDSSVHVAPSGNFAGERGSVFVVNGQTGRSNSFLVDGLDNNDQTSGTSLGSFFSQQVIREFVVQTHQYSAEFGRAAGGVLNIVTHQGSNSQSGELFVQGTTERWNETGDFISALDVAQESAQNRPDRLQLGFRFGGPIKRDKAFYFLAYEHQDRDEIVSWPGRNRNGTLGGWVVAPARSDNLFFRTDFNLSPSQTLMVRLSADDRESPDINIGGRLTDEVGFDVEERDFQLAASLTSVLSPGMFNEVRFLAGTSEFNQFANSSRPGVNRSSGVWGGNELNRQLRDESRLQLVDNLTLMKNDHTFKIGADVTYTSTDLLADFNPAGNFLYTTDDAFEAGDCGNLVATDVLNVGGDIHAPIECPGTVGVDDDGDGMVDEPGFFYTYPLVYTYIFGTPEAELDDTRVGLFAQDSWQATPRLLLDYGLRYDLSTFTLPASASVESTIPNGGAGRDYDNIAPRLGFTWTPEVNGKLVVRGGAGLFYDKLVLAFPAVAAVTSGTEIGISPIRGFAFEVTPEDVDEQLEVLGPEGYEALLRDSLIFPDNLILRFSTATELETPYAVQYTLGAERKLGSNGSLSLNAIRALGYHVPLMRDLNPVVSFNCALGGMDEPEPGKLPCLGVPLHRDDGTGSIAAITTEGRSWYSGVDLAYRWRGQDAWGSASYTWSKADDLGPDPLKGGIYLPPNSDYLPAEKGPSDADRRHRLVISGEVGLPWMGLRASGVLRLYSELPYNITTGRDENGDGINTDRPAGVGRNSGADAALEAINRIRVEEGLSPVSSLSDSPSFYQVDLRVAKPFAYRGGKSKGELFVQVFNLLNRFNGGPLEGQVTSVNFGRPTGQVGPPRIVELGFKTGY
jgi:hypothetical protein